jgi:hypothetical protein
MFNDAAGNTESNIEKNTGTKYVFIPEGPISEKLSHASFISDLQIKNNSTLETQRDHYSNTTDYIS